MKSGAGRRPKNGVAPMTERIQIRVTTDAKQRLEDNNVDLSAIVDGIARGLPRKSPTEDLPKAS
jgi:hypothetical protein